MMWVQRQLAVFKQIVSVFLQEDNQSGVLTRKLALYIIIILHNHFQVLSEIQGDDDDDNHISDVMMRLMMNIKMTIFPKYK